MPRPRKLKTRNGRRTFTPEEIYKIIPQLQGDRCDALKIADKYGLNHNHVDVLRILCGYTRDMHGKRSEEQCQKIIECYKANPDKSAYQLFKEHGKELGLSDYQAFYHVLNRFGIESNRKREFWTPIKEKKLIYARDVQHLPWKQIHELFGRQVTVSAMGQKYAKLKRKEKIQNEN